MSGLVFISYSHKDEEWKQKFVEQLSALGLKDSLEVWHDRRIATGADWKDEVIAAIEKAKVAVLLVSAYFLSSDFIRQVEIPLILSRREEDGLRVIPLLVRHCPWKQIPWLARLNFAPKDGIPLARRSTSRSEQILSDLAEEVEELIRSMHPINPLPPTVLLKKLVQPAKFMIPTPEPKHRDKMTGRLESDSRQTLTSAISVELVQDYYSQDILSALDLYDARIPDGERIEAPDIVRWLREGAAEHYFFIARYRNHVCGFSLIHAGPAWPIAFVAYMVAGNKPLALMGEEKISPRLVEEMAKLFKQGERLARCEEVLLEVDSPITADSEKERQQRVARIRLFCTLAAREGFLLRALGFDYRQPALRIPVEGERVQEERMLLMLGVRPPMVGDGRLSRAKVESILRFIYKWLYPSGFSMLTAENEVYISYLDELYSSQIASLADSVPTLSLSDLRAQWRDR